jgi:hypothetical protein
MTPVSRNLDIVQGLTFGPILFTAKDSSNVVVDITGWSAFAEARAKPCGALAFDIEPEVTDAAAGEIEIEFTDAETAALPIGRYGWDLVLENPAGERFGPFAAGTVSVRELHTHYP